MTESQTTGLGIVCAVFGMAGLIGGFLLERSFRIALLPLGLALVSIGMALIAVGVKARNR